MRLKFRDVAAAGIARSGSCQQIMCGCPAVRPIDAAADCRHRNHTPIGRNPESGQTPGLGAYSTILESICGVEQGLSQCLGRQLCRRAAVLTCRHCSTAATASAAGVARADTASCRRGEVAASTRPSTRPRDGGLSTAFGWHIRASPAPRRVAAPPHRYRPCRRRPAGCRPWHSAE